MTLFDKFMAMFLLSIICFQVYAAVTIYKHTKEEPSFSEVSNLKTCANLLENGQLNHITQQSTCADLIRRTLP